MTRATTIAERLDAVRVSIAEACTQSGRDPGEVTLIAVSKGVEIAKIVEAARAGQRDFGENYLQHALAKMDALAEIAEFANVSVNWHMIGQLQSNKAAKVARRFSCIHSLDSISAVTVISKTMQAEGRDARVLVQVRLGGGSERGGVEPAALTEFASTAAGLPGLRLEGLMGVAPAGEPAGPHFERLRGLLESFRSEGFDDAPLRQLSMGMSGDYREAIREGATMVRIGSAIFGPRAQPVVDSAG